MLVGPARLIGSLVVSAQLTRAGVERVYDLIEAEPDVVDPAEPVALPGGPLSVELDRVTFGYTRRDPVLDDVSLRVAPGETLALVGPPGSGKSTAALLLPRFYDPEHGELRLGGVPLRALRLAELRRELGVVFEEAFLFSDTMRANIAYGRPGATDAEIEAAARAAQAHAFVQELPQGYQTVVGERGLTLSGGQRQRIALARAVLTDPRVLVLDDAMSAVDTVTESAIQETLRGLVAGRTTLLVAHRRSTLALADRIAVLDAGRVVDVGTEAELTDRCPLFRELFGLVGVLGGAAGSATEGCTPELWPAVDEAAATTGRATAAAVRSAAGAVGPRGMRAGRSGCGRGGRLDAAHPRAARGHRGPAAGPVHPAAGRCRPDRARAGLPARPAAAPGPRAAGAGRAAGRAGRAGLVGLPDRRPVRGGRRDHRRVRVGAARRDPVRDRVGGRRLARRGRPGRGHRTGRGEPALPAARAQLCPPAAARAGLLRARAVRSDHDQDDHRRRRAVDVPADRAGPGGGQPADHRRASRWRCCSPTPSWPWSRWPCCRCWSWPRCCSGAARRPRTPRPGRRSARSTPTCRRTSPACGWPRPTCGRSTAPAGSASAATPTGVPGCAPSA